MSVVCVSVGREYRFKFFVLLNVSRRPVITCYIRVICDNSFSDGTISVRLSPWASGKPRLEVIREIFLEWRREDIEILEEVENAERGYKIESRRRWLLHGYSRDLTEFV